MSTKGRRTSASKSASAEAPLQPAKSSPTGEELKAKSSDSQTKTLVPPHSMRVRYKMRILVVRSDTLLTQHLQIYEEVFARVRNLHITKYCLRKTQHHLENLSLLLCCNSNDEIRFDYPQSIQVNVEGIKAELDRGGSLEVTLPIVQILDKDSGKLLRKKVKGVPSEPVKSHKKTQNTSDMLRIVSEVNDVEDKKRNAKIDHAEAKQSYQSDKEVKKNQRKHKSKVLREQSLAAARKRQRDEAEDTNPRVQKRPATRNQSTQS